MKHNVTQLESKNELVNSVLGNYFIELEPGNYQAEEASSTSDTQPNLLRFSWADEIDCKIVDLVLDIVFLRPSFVVFDNGQAFVVKPSPLTYKFPDLQGWVEN